MFVTFLNRNGTIRDNVQIIIEEDIDPSTGELWEQLLFSKFGSGN